MEYQYYIVSAPDSFDMADAICRALEDAGKSCYFNLRDSMNENKMPDAYRHIGDITSLVAIVNDEFLSNTRLVSPISFYSKKTSTDKVFILQNKLISSYPPTWRRFRLLNATKGLNKDIINLIKGTETLAEGTESLAEGAETLAEGTETLAEDTESLAEDTESLALSSKNVELSAPLWVSPPIPESASVSSPVNISSELLQNQESIQTSDVDERKGRKRILWILGILIVGLLLFELMQRLDIISI